MSWFLLAVAAVAPASVPELKNAEALALSEVRRVQASFARCVVRRRASVAERYVLDADPKSRLKLSGRVGDPECLAQTLETFGTTQMRFPADTMRYALAEALVRYRLPKIPLQNLEAIPPLAHPAPIQADPGTLQDIAGRPLTAAELADIREVAVATPYLSRLGECVVRFNPAASYALLMTDADSTAEDTAIESIKGALANCIDAGRALKLNKMTVRGTVALNYFRLAKAPRSAPAAPAGGSLQ